MLVSALFDSSSEVNAIYLTFTHKLGLSIRPTDIRTQKIDGTMLDTYGMVVAAFSMTNKGNGVRFFEKTFLMANISPEVIFGMFFSHFERCRHWFLRSRTPIEDLYYQRGPSDYQTYWVSRKEKVCNCSAWPRTWDLHNFMLHALALLHPSALSRST